MGEHKTGRSNWTPEQRKLYRERRERGLRGSLGYVKVHSVVKDDEGNEQRIPHANTGQRPRRVN